MISSHNVSNLFFKHLTFYYCIISFSRFCYIVYVLMDLHICSNVRLSCGVITKREWSCVVRTLTIQYPCKMTRFHVVKAIIKMASPRPRQSLSKPKIPPIWPRHWGVHNKNSLANRNRNHPQQSPVDREVTTLTRDDHKIKVRSFERDEGQPDNRVVSYAKISRDKSSNLYKRCPVAGEHVDMT